MTGAVIGLVQLEEGFLINCKLGNIVDIGDQVISWTLGAASGAEVLLRVISRSIMFRWCSRSRFFDGISL